MRGFDEDQKPAITDTTHNPTVMDSESNRANTSDISSDMPLAGVSGPFSGRTEGYSSTSSSVVSVSQQANQSSGVRRNPEREDPDRRVRRRPDDDGDGDDGDDGDDDDDDDGDGDDYRYESDSEPDGAYNTDGEDGDGNWHAWDSDPDD